MVVAVILFLNYICQKRTQTLFINSRQRIFVIPACICYGILATIGYILAVNWIYIIVISCLFLAVMVLPWYRILNKIYETPETQQQQKKDLPDIFIRPITYISKMFQLFLDMFLSEKIITASVNFVARQSVILFLKVNKKRYIINLWGIILGYLIFIAAFMAGGK